MTWFRTNAAILITFVFFGLTACAPRQANTKDLAIALHTEAASAISPSFESLVRSASSLSNTQLQQFMRDDHYAVRCLGALAAGFDSRVSLAPNIVELLVDPVSEVQVRALMALGWLGDPAYAADAAILVESEEPRVAAAAFDVLSFWIGLDKIVLLTRQKIASGDIRTKDIQLFGAFADPSELPALSKFLLEDSPEELRTATITVIQKRFAVPPVGSLAEQTERCRQTLHRLQSR